MKSEGLTPAQLAERNAEYVTEISRLEKACAALAAENARLKAICEDRRTFIMNGVQLGFIKVPTVEIDPALEGEPAEFGKNRTLRFSGHP